MCEFSARAGFPLLTVPDLRRLVGHLKIFRSGALPSARAGLVRLLLGRLWPDCPEEKLQELMAMEASRTKVVYTGTMTTDDIDELQASDVIDVEEADGGKKALAPRASKAASSSKQSAPVEPKTASTSDHPPVVAKRHRQQRNAPAPTVLSDDMTVERVAELIPAVKGCSIGLDLLWHNRWRARYPAVSPPATFSRSWGSGEVLTPRSCLRDCLAWVWARHHEKTGEACPWSFVV